MEIIIKQRYASGVADTKETRKQEKTRNNMKSSMSDYEVEKIEETKILEVLRK